MPNGMQIPDNAAGNNFPGENGLMDENRGNMTQMGMLDSQSSNGIDTWILLGSSVVILLAGLIFAIKFKR
ncbi:MAG: hypothetical protein ACLRZ7_03520 [Lachnospiraceae bacterium]